MRAGNSPFEVMRHTFWLGDSPVETDHRMQRIADCLGEILPEIEQAVASYGDRRVIWALTAIIVDLALESGDHELAAAILRTNARLLELRGSVELLGSDPL